ncbi:hypothetical protein CHX27_01015 [Flavobacterium aurantiibacter]|uniref:Uncharacterized protein n=1 Tax=Flavobacterium aurantiibacter TaxID=2023067 RepID=A0A256A8L0_9FLAO|nr:hypothetical protein CHX27_01015 [Flavobacterium aurantiibacter]
MWLYCNSVFEFIFFDVANSIFSLVEKMKGNDIVEIGPFDAINYYFLVCWLFVLILLVVGFIFRKRKDVLNGLLVTIGFHLALLIVLLFKFD